MPFDDLFYKWRILFLHAGKFVTLVQSLKHAENSFKVLRFDPEPVIAHREHPSPRFFCFGVEMCTRRNPRVLVFYGIANQVLKQLKVNCISSPRTSGQWIMRYFWASAAVDGAG